jgi:hypothetical protein
VDGGGRRYAVRGNHSIVGHPVAAALAQCGWRVLRTPVLHGRRIPIISNSTRRENREITLAVKLLRKLVEWNGSGYMARTCRPQSRGYPDRSKTGVRYIPRGSSWTREREDQGSSSGSRSSTRTCRTSYSMTTSSGNYRTLSGPTRGLRVPRDSLRNGWHQLSYRPQRWAFGGRRRPMTIASP